LDEKAATLKQQLAKDLASGLLQKHGKLLGSGRQREA
jgi:hypothetical protein